MDDEVEDIVGDVKYTDSQKSVATSNIYSLDFTDSSSDKNNSSGKDTYVIEYNDSDDSDKPFQLHGNQSIMNLNDKAGTPIRVNRGINVHNEPRISSRAASTSYHNCVVAQETFTQTSKTIIELAETETKIRNTVDNNTLQTQTSFVSITENKTIEYRIEVSGSHKTFSRNEITKDNPICTACHKACDHSLNHSLEDGSSKLALDLISETEDEKADSSSNEEVLNIINEESKDNILSLEQNESQYENTSDFDQSDSDSDIEQDSLIEVKDTRELQNNVDSFSDVSDIPKSVENDVEDLYKKFSENFDVCVQGRTCEPVRCFDALTTLTEESTNRKDSLIDITPNVTSVTEETDKDLLFTNNGIKVKVLPESNTNKDTFKLPPIRNNSCPSSPHLNFLFSVKSRPLSKSGTLPCLLEGQERRLDRWDIDAKDLASGESPFISGRNDMRDDSFQLPPIHADNVNCTKNNNYIQTIMKVEEKSTPTPRDTINIKEKIMELKMNNKNTKRRPLSKYNITRAESRSGSPGSTCSPTESRLCDPAERGCEALCAELLRRLKSSSWYEVSETLEEVPRMLDKFWGVITENRIADLIRQVCSHVESPRTQVARCACNTLATILKNTNYTKKPDFYEAVTTLLSKTGCFSRPVRRAANMALDDIVSGVDLTHAVTALCIHGTSHKSALVRCASARLLVVCCALGGGGRDLLRARPPTAASARRYALRSLAALLEDKNTDARKYAERLYSMLRPLSNFEAYYLTDVDVELASRQMKKYDQLLLCGPPKDTR